MTISSKISQDWHRYNLQPSDHILLRLRCIKPWKNICYDIPSTNYLGPDCFPKSRTRRQQLPSPVNLSTTPWDNSYLQWNKCDFTTNRKSKLQSTSEISVAPFMASMGITVSGLGGPAGGTGPRKNELPVFPCWNARTQPTQATTSTTKATATVTATATATTTTTTTVQEEQEFPTFKSPFRALSEFQ